MHFYDSELLYCIDLDAFLHCFMISVGCSGLLWAALDCSGLLWAALGCSGLLGSDLRRFETI